MKTAGQFIALPVGLLIAVVVTDFIFGTFSAPVLGAIWFPYLMLGMAFVLAVSVWSARVALPQFPNIGDLVGGGAAFMFIVTYGLHAENGTVAFWAGLDIAGACSIAGFLVSRIPRARRLERMLAS